MEARASADLLQRIAAAGSAAAPAIVAGDRAHDRGALLRAVGSLARRLRREGVEPGARVAILADNDPVALVGLLAAVAAGAVAVPVNVRLTARELAAVLDDAEPAAIVAAGAHAAAAGAAAEERVPRPALVVLDDPFSASDASLDPLPAGPIAAIFYTGGTTGEPKGVALTPGNLIANAQAFAELLGLHPGQRYLHAAPDFHLAGAAAGIASLLSGGVQVMPGRFRAGAAVTLLRGGEADWTTLVPTMVGRLCAELRPGERPLPLLVYGGSAMPAATARQAIDRVCRRIVQTYGLSEATSLVCALTDAEHRHALASDPALLETCGRPVGASRVRVDPATGELLVAGPTVMAGYWNRPELTSATVVDGWLRTGDAATIGPRGHVRLHGRLREQIASGGEKVMPREVERALAELAGVREAAVVGVPDAEWGERVHAAVSVEDGFDLELARRELRARLADFKRPRSWTVTQGPLPRTGVGKLDTRAIRAAASEEARA